MTLEQMQAEIRFRLGGTRRSDLQSGDGLTALNNWIDFAYRSLVHTIRFPQFERLDTTQSTSVSNAYITIPTGIYNIFTIFDITNANYIEPLPGGWEEYERRGVLSANAGKPSRWTRLNNLVYFEPRPDAVYALRLFALDEPSLIAPGTEPVIPEVWHMGIVFRAVAEGWIAYDEPEKSASAMKQYAQHLGSTRTQRGVESHGRRSRGIKVFTGATNPRLGV
jgi:hypothetical protein